MYICICACNFTWTSTPECTTTIRTPPPFHTHTHTHTHIKYTYILYVYYMYVRYERSADLPAHATGYPACVPSQWIARFASSLTSSSRSTLPPRCPVPGSVHHTPLTRNGAEAGCKGGNGEWFDSVPLYTCLNLSDQVEVPWTGLELTTQLIYLWPYIIHTRSTINLHILLFTMHGHIAFPFYHPTHQLRHFIGHKLRR